MMSSEEDTECFGLYGDKLLLKKNKRTRQRVDAGEPRNSYSSIPNFSSRPSFMSGGLYGALLSQSQQHFGLFGPNGFGSAKMLNELFGRQVKQAQDASGPDNMLSMESASSTDGTSAGGIGIGLSGSKHGFESASSNSSPIIRRTSSSGVETDGGGNTPPQQQQNDLAHHMLRNILQGKKELMALDHELRSAASHINGTAICDRASPDNNNSISKNNNNNNSNSNNNNNSANSINNNNNNVSVQQQDVKSEVVTTKPNNGTSTVGGASVNSLSGGAGVNSGSKAQQQKSDEVGASGLTVSETIDGVSSDNDENDLQDRLQDHHHHLVGGVTKKEREDILDEQEIMELNNSRSDLESLGSPDSTGNDDVQMKDELEAEMNADKERDGGSPMAPGANKEPVALDMKRARVENIVSTMRSSPSFSTQPQVNGCKKRKLYQPQQHDNSAAERYAAVAAGLNLGLNIHSLMLDEDDDDELESPQIQQKRVEKNALKSQLRSMQEQLAEMQQKYVQLCSRMEQESECQEIDDTGSDIIEQEPEPEQDDISDSPPIEKPERLSPVVSPVKEISTKTHNAPNMLSQMMSKMMSSKLHNPLGSHPHMPQTFNGTHSLFQHIHHGGVGNEHGVQNAHMPHHAISNAAAMYLGQKFFLEQEARMAKEVADHHERQQQQQQHHQQQQQHHQQQQQHLQQQQHQQQQQQQQQNHHQVQQQQQQSLQQQQQSQQQSQQQQQPPPQAQPHQNSLQQQHQHSQHQQQMNGNQQSAQGHHSSSSSSSQTQPPMRQSPMSKLSNVQSDLSEKFNIIRSSTNSVGPMSGTDLEGLADILKSEITASLSTLVDSIVTRFVHQRRFLGKQSEAAAAAAEQLNKDLLMASQLLDRKSPRIKVADRSNSNNNNNSGSNQSGNGPSVNSANNQPNSSISHSSNSILSNQNNGQRINGSAFPPMGLPMHVKGPPPDSNNTSSLSSLNIPPHVRPSPSAAMFQAPKPPQAMNPVAAAALYNSMNALSGHANPVNPFCMPEPRDQNQEQNEALSLVVTPKKKRHKVTDTRITPRTVSRILAQDGIGPPPNQMDQVAPNNSHSKFNNQPVNGPPTSTPSDTPSPRSSYHPPPPPAMMPVSLPTSVAIPNPSLHESQVFSPYSPFFNPHGPHGPHGPHAPQPSQLHHMKMSSSPPGLCGMIDSRDSPPLPHPPTMLHPALLAAAHHGGSPDYGHLRAAMDAMDANDRNSDCNSGDISFDGIQPTISFSNAQYQNQQMQISLTSLNSSTLTPMHLRKAKLMFFWVRYPSSAVLKMYFPDIKFNKNNTAQLVKWFSNFREFYYIQMEKYARQAVTEGVKNADDLHVSGDSELYRVLNLHYNRNNHIEVPPNFRYVVEQTLREFFRAIQSGKDTEQSWKKSIYKIIQRLDDPVPEYFKSPNFLEQLE